MKLSTKTRYGLRAVVEMAKWYGMAPAKRKEIAKAQGLSDSYLENILIILKNSRIVGTTRGANGGYVLTRSPEQITVLEVINALEGTLELVDCVADEMSCDRTETCVERTVWRELTLAWNATLGNLTLRDLLNREQALYAATYAI